MKLRLNAVAFAAIALSLGQGAWAGEAEAKKWIDSEFQPSTLNKDQQMAEMKWFIEAAKKLPGPLYVVKAQIHAGGRGKAGGVKVVKSAAEARTAAAGMLGKTLKTYQTGPEGQLVRRLWVEQGCEIASEGQELELT